MSAFISGKAFVVARLNELIIEVLACRDPKHLQELAAEGRGQFTMLEQIAGNETVRRLARNGERATRIETAIGGVRL